jgi:hypothetical protein
MLTFISLKYTQSGLSSKEKHSTVQNPKKAYTQARFEPSVLMAKTMLAGVDPTKHNFLNF